MCERGRERERQGEREEEKEREGERRGDGSKSEKRQTACESLVILTPASQWISLVIPVI